MWNKERGIPLKKLRHRIANNIESRLHFDTQMADVINLPQLTSFDRIKCMRKSGECVPH